MSLSAAAAAAAFVVFFLSFFTSNELTSWLLPGAVVTAESAACSLPADRRGGTDHNFQFSGVKAVSRWGGTGGAVSRGDSPLPLPPPPALQCVQARFCGPSVFCTVTPLTISQRRGGGVGGGVGGRLTHIVSGR